MKRLISVAVAGGEDLFELLDERVPTPLVIPPAPVVADTPVVGDTPVIESGAPSGYTAPVFFPFGKPEPTAPQLKLSGVSSFKKINRCGRSKRSFVSRYPEVAFLISTPLRVMGMSRVLVEHRPAVYLCLSNHLLA